MLENEGAYTWWSPLKMARDIKKKNYWLTFLVAIPPPHLDAFYHFLFLFYFHSFFFTRRLLGNAYPPPNAPSRSQKSPTSRRASNLFYKHPFFLYNSL